jgi:hypothetical protein
MTGKVPAFAAPVMAPIAAPAATLSAAGAAPVGHAAGPDPRAEVPDPTSAVKAAIAAAALEAEAATAAEPAPARASRPEVARAAAPARSVRASVPSAAAATALSAVSTVLPPAEDGVPPRTASSGRLLRRLLPVSVAAVLLVGGLLSLSGALLDRAPRSEAVPASAGMGLNGAASGGQVALANGMLLQTVVTSGGARAVVSALPEGAMTDLQVGDVLLVYAATGEMIDSAEGVNDLLMREIANGVATFGFAVQRDGKMAVGFIGLPEFGKADLDVKDQDLEKKT